jgi:hypothetical protein
MAGFVEVSIDVQAAQLATEALERLEALMQAQGYIGWKAQAAALETILTEALAPIAEDVAQVAVVVPPAIFRNYGTKLLGLPYNEGAAATASTTFTLLDTAGHTIPAGLQVQQGNLAFYTSSETVVAAGHSTATVQVVAVIQGTEYNGLTGLLEPVEAIDWLKEVTIVGETTGGAEQEEDSAYQNRLQAALQLQAPRPITASDYAIFVRDAPSTILPTGVVVGRSTSIDGYNPGTTALTGTTTEHSTTLSEVSSFTGLTAGSELEGVAIPLHTTVISVNEGAKTLVMSVEASATHSKEAVNSIGSYGNERCVCTFVTDVQGKELSAEAMGALEGWLESHREIGFITPVREPSYSEVYCTVKCHILPAYEEASVIASVKSALEAYLNPSTWANPEHSSTGANAWLNRVQGFNIVRWNSLVGLIESVPGVGYVFPGSEGLKTGFSASPSGTVDLTLYGPAPLAKTKAANLVVTVA